MVLLAEIVSSCSHAKVAQAAVASIGGDFPRRVERAAAEQGISAGVFAARSVHLFGVNAGHLEWRALADLIAGKDMPVLTGLRYILERAMAEAVQPGDSRDAGDAVALYDLPIHATLKSCYLGELTNCGN